MADLSDVLNVIVGMTAAIVYPHGTSAPSITSSIVKVYPGWPVPNKLQSDIASGGVHISVYPLPTERKIPTQLGRPYRVVNAGNPTTHATVNGSLVTLSGSITTPQNVYFLIDSVGYHYSVQSSDTLTTIATAMASQIPGASNAGPVISIPNAKSISARTGGIGSAARELRRQAKDFQVTIWAPTPALRDTIGGALDSALSENSALSFSDGAPAFMVYSRTLNTDASENYLVYRRDLVYTVNYATTQTISAPQVVAPVMTINTSIKNI